MSNIDVSKYSHSPVHKAVASRDYASLRRILAALPQLSNPSDILTESSSLSEESKADAIASVIDRRDVPNRDSPLHLAVKMGDEAASEMLMLAGADWSLQNEQGWSALQEAICNREEGISTIIVRHYQPLAWAKWCRRLPRLVATMHRMRDFYMEINFQFESSVIPFVSRIAPSDTYKIWKRGSSLRADMTLAGFDGFKIQRSDQTVLFLGDGSYDGRVPPGTLCILSHKDREVTDALEGACSPASESEVRQEVTAMSRTNIFRPGIDVTQAVLIPQSTWRRHERTETVGAWKAKVYDVHNVVVSIKSRKVPGAISDDELFSSRRENDTESEGMSEILTEDERRQLEAALGTVENEERMIWHRHSCYEHREIPVEDSRVCKDTRKQEKKSWFGGRRKKDSNTMINSKNVRPRSSVSNDEKVSDLLGDSSSRSQVIPGRRSVDETARVRNLKPCSGRKESEYKKGLRPVLWLSQNFPLQIEELLPLLDILANRVKAVRRLQELLTTKLPLGTFPVKVAIPVVPTIRVLVTFTKFEELGGLDEFLTPQSSPSSKESLAGTKSSSSSWFNWVAPYTDRHSISITGGASSKIETIKDPFAIPAGYTWVTAQAKKEKMQENKSNGKS